MKPLDACLKDSGLTKDKIDEVLLVGGQTRMPKVKESVKDFFGKSPN
jgi:molecular chaperone DnaK